MNEGFLKHNEQGRLELENSTYFTSGDQIEIFYDEMWLKGRIEYSQKYEDYYFLKEDEGIYIYSLDGIKARV